MAAVPPVVADPDAQISLNLAVDNVDDPADQRYLQAAKRYDIANAIFATGQVTGDELHEHHEFRARCSIAAAGDAAVGGVPAWFGPALAATLPDILRPVLENFFDPLFQHLDNAETRLGNRINNVETRLDNRINNVETNLGNRINNVETNLGNRINNVETNLGNRINNVETNLGNRLDHVEAHLRNVQASLIIVQARQQNSLATRNTDLLHPFPNAMGIAAPNFPENFLVLTTMDGEGMRAFLAHYWLPIADDNDDNLQRIKKFIGIRVA